MDWLCSTPTLTNFQVKLEDPFTPSINGDYAVIVSLGNCIDTSACIPGNRSRNSKNLKSKFD